MSQEELAAMFGHAEEAPAADDVAALARAYLAERHEKESAEILLKNATERLEKAESALIARMAEVGVKSIKIEDGGFAIGLTSTISHHYSAPVGSLEDGDFFRWLLRSGGHDLVRRNIHHASFSSFCRELTEAGRPIHEIVKIVERKTIKVKKD